MTDIYLSQEIEVAWCTKDGYGTRLIPDGTLKGVHFLQTPDYVKRNSQFHLSMSANRSLPSSHKVQITGEGDFTTMNVVANDDGGMY